MFRCSLVKFLVSAFVLSTGLSHAAVTVLVDHTNPWHYHKGTNEPVAAWKILAAEDLDSTWLVGPGGIGYADNATERTPLGTQLLDMRTLYRSFHVRQEFEVTGPINPTDRLILTMDYDDGFIAWLDGRYLTSANSPNGTNQPPISANASGTHESSRGNSSPQPVVTYDLGPAGNLLPPGTHVLALMALNDSPSSSDCILIADLAVGTIECLPNMICSDTNWTAANSPYVVSNTTTVASSAKLTIEPGVTVLFAQGAGLIVNGQLIAMGEPSNRITFTRNTGATSWGRIDLTANNATSYIAHADFSFSTGNVRGNGTTVFLQDLTWSNTTAQLVDVVGCSITLLDSFIPGGFGNEPIHFSSFPANGHALIKGNVFGAPAGYNDSIDFTGGNRPGPIVQFIDNVFLRAVDDCLDLDGTDAHIEGNIFINVHQDVTRDSTANAIATGADGGNTSELTIVRNLFYDMDHALLLKNAGSAVFDNNTVVTIRSNQFSVVLPACINFGEPHRGDPDGRGLLMDGNIFWDVRAQAPFLNLKDSIFMIMNRSIMPNTNVAGINNSTNDPMLVNWQGPITAANIRSNFALLPGSPAIGAGPNGLDMGALVPSGASISPMPPTTNETNVTVRVAGPGVVAFRWKLNNSPWSAEIPLTNAFLITTNYWNPTNGLVALNNLTNGSYTLYAIGKNSAGFWQSTNAAASRSWTVQPEALRVDRITKDGGTVRLYFQANAGQTYSVQFRNSLATGNWLRLTDASGNGEVEVVDPKATVSERFYRIVTPAQP